MRNRKEYQTIIDIVFVLFATTICLWQIQIGQNDWKPTHDLLWSQEELIEGAMQTDDSCGISL